MIIVRTLRRDIAKYNKMDEEVRMIVVWMENKLNRKCLRLLLTVKMIWSESLVPLSTSWETKMFVHCSDFIFWSAIGTMNEWMNFLASAYVVGWSLTSLLLCHLILPLTTGTHLCSHYFQNRLLENIFLTLHWTFRCITHTILFYIDSWLWG